MLFCPGAEYMEESQDGHRRLRGMLSTVRQPRCEEINLGRHHFEGDPSDSLN